MFKITHKFESYWCWKAWLYFFFGGGGERYYVTLKKCQSPMYSFDFSPSFLWPSCFFWWLLTWQLFVFPSDLPFWKGLPIARESCEFMHFHISVNVTFKVYFSEIFRKSRKSVHFWIRQGLLMSSPVQILTLKFSLAIWKKRILFFFNYSCFIHLFPLKGVWKIIAYGCELSQSEGEAIVGFTQCC